MSSSADHRPRAASRLIRILSAGALVSAVGLVAGHESAQAASFVVTTTTDGGAGSLRDAISQANANPGPDTITVPAGTYTITIAGADEEINATGDFDIFGDLTIVGAGAANTIIDAAGLDRVFDLHLGVLVLDSMTITNGDAGSGSGGNILERAFTDVTVIDSVVSHGNALRGGGISGSQGSLMIVRSEIIDNVVTSVQGSGAIGAGIYKDGPANGALSMEDSLVAGNSSTDGNAALYIAASATVTNSTITGNSVAARTVMVENYMAVAISAEFVHVTIAGNTTSSNIPGHAINVNVSAPGSMSVNLEGTLIQGNVAGPNPSNCAVVAQGVIASDGHNLVDDASCFLTQPTDSPSDSGTTLAALADNGGPTRTLALVAGSSAIDAAGACGAATSTDQRGVARPFGAACDVGAYEADAIVEETTTSSTTSTASSTSTTSPILVDSTSSTSTSSTSTTAAATTSTTGLGSGGNGTTTTLPFIPPTTFPRGLPVTGGSPDTSLWLAALATCLGGLLIFGARRLAR